MANQTNDSITDKLRNFGPWVFSCFVIIGYACFIYLLINKTSSTTLDPEWIRLIYIFSSIESIVFTAVGFIFGREVNRSRAINAERNEINAKRQRDELANEVLEKIPDPPQNPSSTNADAFNLSSLKNMAKNYLNK